MPHENFFPQQKSLGEGYVSLLMLKYIGPEFFPLIILMLNYVSRIYI